MKIDLGAWPNRTLIGIVLVALGVLLEVWIYTDPDSMPVLLMYIAPLIFGLGLGVLWRLWYDTRRLRQEAKEWADANPGEEPPQSAPPPPPPPPATPAVPPEDDPNWVAWARRQVDNPENPTDGTGEKGQ